jgi:hypothetical protein
MKSTLEQVFQAVHQERDYQDSRWDSSTTATCGVHSNVEFLAFIQDYVNEALHYCARHGEPGATEFSAHSLRKIAAMAVAALEQNGVQHRPR